jgi:hypothetical protein
MLKGRAAEYLIAATIFCISTAVHGQILTGPVEDLASPPVQPKRPGELFKPESSCSRFFVYRNQVYPLDSSRKQDGEGLRFVLSKNPKSLELLNDYQKTLRYSRWPAYVGSVGLVIAAGGAIFSTRIQPAEHQRPVRMISIASGISIMLASYAYGQHLMYVNESSLVEALAEYNQAAEAKDRIKTNDYMAYLKVPQWPLYTGLFGVTTMRGALAVASTVKGARQSKLVQNIGLATGLFITVGSFGYRQWVQKPAVATTEGSTAKTESDGGFSSQGFAVLPLEGGAGAQFAATFSF